MNLQPAPKHFSEVEAQKKLAAQLWHYENGIATIEASELTGNGLRYMHPVQHAEVIRIPSLSRMPSTLIFAFHFQPVRDRENDIMWWEARAEGYIFRIFND